VADGSEYTGTLKISIRPSFSTAICRSGSTAGLSRETPMAITFAMAMASSALFAIPSRRINQPVTVLDIEKVAWHETPLKRDRERICLTLVVG
jgi:hypothetical protein